MKFLKTLALLCVLLTPAHAAKHVEASPLSVSTGEFAAWVTQVANLPKTEGHITWQLLTHSEDSLIYKFTVNNRKRDLDLRVFAAIARAERIEPACKLLMQGPVVNLQYMEFIFKDYVGRDLVTITLSKEDCT